MKEIIRATEKLFEERKDFVIIGLTGRTGSGCSLTAKLLSKGEFKPPKPLKNENMKTEDRKYEIAFNYFKENWKAFEVIEIKSVIFSFILKYTFEDFLDYIKSLESENIHFVELDKLIENLSCEIKDSYDKCYSIREEVKEIFQDDGSNEKSLEDDKIYNYYFKLIPDIANKFYLIWRKYQVEIYDKKRNITQSNAYIYIMQKIGNNIRSSGWACEEDFNPEMIFIMPQRINLYIKILRKRNLLAKKSEEYKNARVLVVIDALRNPYEISFFKDRYASFYTFAITTEDENRRNRLIEKGFNNNQIDNLDKQEYPDKIKGSNKFLSQNIGKCLENADVYLYNPQDNSGNYKELKQQLVRYISLIFHPGLVTPTHIERCMQTAFIAKSNSGCISRHVGAVITGSDFSIKAMGWNSVPEGQVSCNLRSIYSLSDKEDSKAFSKYELNNEKFNSKVSSIVNGEFKTSSLSGRNYSYCFKDIYNTITEKSNQVHTRALHAEENAFLQISKWGGAGVHEGNLFTTASPCELCSKKAYQIGIKNIYYIDPYPGISNEHILDCGLRKPNLILFNGAVGRAYIQLYSTILDYKDELEMLNGI